MKASQAEGVFLWWKTDSVRVRQTSEHCWPPPQPSLGSCYSSSLRVHLLRWRARPCALASDNTARDYAHYKAAVCRIKHTNLNTVSSSHWYSLSYIFSTSANKLWSVAELKQAVMLCELG